MPNVIAIFEAPRPGPHLVLNGHMDVFPEQEIIPGERDQWSGDIDDGKVYGRGA
jgi:succinyl-diaminopimelate desuccinylase